jgi:hypothetical protein
MANKIQKMIRPSLNLISNAPYAHIEANLDMVKNALNPAKLLKKMGLNKRSGDSIEEILYSLILMPLLKVRSIFSFLITNFR